MLSQFIRPINRSQVCTLNITEKAPRKRPSLTPNQAKLPVALSLSASKGRNVYRLRVVAEDNRTRNSDRICHRFWMPPKMSPRKDIWARPTLTGRTRATDARFTLATLANSRRHILRFAPKTNLRARRNATIIPTRVGESDRHLIMHVFRQQYARSDTADSRDTSRNGKTRESA